MAGQPMRRGRKMKGRTARAGAVALILLLGACAFGPQPARGMNDPAVQRLFTASTPDYYAALNIAGQIAKSCPRYTYDSVLDLEINERRNEAGRGSLAALSLSREIERATIAARAAFAQRHGVDLTSGRADLCAAADVEAREGSALSAVLIPTG